MIKKKAQSSMLCNIFFFFFLFYVFMDWLESKWRWCFGLYNFLEDDKLKVTYALEIMIKDCLYLILLVSFQKFINVGLKANPIIVGHHIQATTQLLKAWGITSSYKYKVSQQNPIKMTLQWYMLIIILI